MIGESGYGAKAPILDAAGRPIIGTDNQPLVTTPGVARVAGQQIADTTTDLPAAEAAFDAQVGVGWEPFGRRREDALIASVLDDVLGRTEA